MKKLLAETDSDTARKAIDFVTDQRIWHKLKKRCRIDAEVPSCRGPVELQGDHNTHSPKRMLTTHTRPSRTVTGTLQRVSFLPAIEADMPVSSVMPARSRGATGLLRTLLFVAVGGIGAIGCASASVDNPVSERAAAANIRIDVRNRNFSDATLHVLRGGERHRLGIVTGKTDESYTVDWPTPLTLLIEIDLLASSRCLTQPLDLNPGDVVLLQIEETPYVELDCINISRYPR